MKAKILDKISLLKVLTVIGGCMVIGTAFFVYSSYNSFQDKVDTLNADINELQAKVDDDKKDTDSALTVDSAKTAVSSVDKAGEDIAKLQNDFKALVDKKRTSADEETVDYAEMKKISEKFDEYFGEGSSFSTSWYTGDSSLLSGGTWEFTSSRNFKGNTISVLWEFVDNNNDVLAYVTGDYHADNNSFDNMAKYVTIAGASYIAPTGDMSDNIDIEKYGEGVVSMFDKLGIDFTPLTKEQEAALEDAHDAQGQLMDQYLKDKGGY